MPLNVAVTCMVHNKLGLTKTSGRNACAEDWVKRRRRPVTGWEKVFAGDASAIGLLCNINKELLNLNNWKKAGLENGQNPSTDTSPKRRYRRKEASPHMSSGSSNENNNEISAHPLEWLKSGILTTHNSRADVEQKGTLSTPGGNENRGSHLGTQCSSFLQNQTYSYHMIRKSRSLAFTQKSWKLTHMRNLHMEVHSSLFVTGKW